MAAIQTEISKPLGVNIEDELMFCAASPQYFIDNYCKTLNPELKPSIVPFTLCPAQDQLQDFLVQSYLGFIPIICNKTKQWGGTWNFKANDLHTILFKEGIPLYDMSRKEKLVDDGGKNSSVNSLFGKMRFMYKHLPPFIKDYAPLEFKHLYIENKANGSYIVGESSNPNAGAGGTYLKGNWDETALTERSETIYAAFKSACRIPWLLSTPDPEDPTGGVFFRIWDANKTSYVKIFLHWSQLPWRSREWYLEQCQDMTDAQIATCLDGRFDFEVPGFVYQGCFVNKPVNEGGNIDEHIKYDPKLPLTLDWDFGYINATSIGFSQTKKVYNREQIEYIADLDVERKTPEEIDELVMKKLKEIGYRGRKDDLINFCDPAAAQTDDYGKNKAYHYGQLGYNLTWVYSGDVLKGIEATKLAFKRKLILFGPECTFSVDALQKYRLPLDKQGKVRPGQKPVKDWTNHRCDGIRYHVINKFPYLLHDPFGVNELDELTDYLDNVTTSEGGALLKKRF